MIEMWLDAYLYGWAIVSICALAFAEALHELRPSQPVARGLLAVLAGALWPVLVLGGLELLGIVFFAKSVRNPEPAPPGEPLLVGADGIEPPTAGV